MKAKLLHFVFFELIYAGGRLKPARGVHSMVNWWKKERLIDCFSYLAEPE
ncbi:hypothetical protein [Niastella populi]|nr:hypothetical protein [Niastella populi]